MRLSVSGSGRGGENESPAPLVHIGLREWSGLAIASFVLSLMWIAGIGSLLAIFIGWSGHKACVNEDKRGDTLAQCGLVFGLLGVALTALIIFVHVSAAQDATPMHTYRPYYSTSS